MVFARCILLASAPAALWLWLFYRRDRWEPEPRLMVLLLFFLGALAAGPAYFVQLHLPGPAGPVFDLLVRVALVEEFFKIAPVLWFASRSSEFDEPMDGIVYAVAAALGFATVENVLYALRLGPSVLVFRAFTSTLAHVAFSGLIGYEIGLARTHARGRWTRVLAALLAMVGLHGAYDLLLSTAAEPAASPLTAKLTIAVMIPTLLLLLRAALRLADRASPFRPGAGPP